MAEKFRQRTSPQSDAQQDGGRISYLRGKRALAVSPAISTSVLEGRYGVLSRSINRDLAHLKRSLRIASRLLEAEAMRNPKATVPINLNGATLKKLADTIDDPFKSDKGLSKQIRKFLKLKGEEIAKRIDDAPHEIPSILAEQVKADVLDVLGSKKFDDNIKSLDKFITYASSLKKSISKSTRFFTVRAQPQIAEAKMIDNINQIKGLREQIDALLAAKALLEMHNMVSLRLSIPVGNQRGDAKRIAEEFYKNQYPKTTTENSEFEEGKAKIMLNERILSLENEIKKTDEYLLFNKRLDKKTFDNLNKSNIFVHAMFDVICNDLEEAENNDLKESLNKLNKDMNNLVKVANSHGGRYTTEDVSITPYTASITDVYLKARNRDEFIIGLANVFRFNRTHPNLFSNDGLNLSEFIWTVAEFKKFGPTSEQILIRRKARKKKDEETAEAEKKRNEETAEKEKRDNELKANDQERQKAYGMAYAEEKGKLDARSNSATTIRDAKTIDGKAEES